MSLSGCEFGRVVCYYVCKAVEALWYSYANGWFPTVCCCDRLCVVLLRAREVEVKGYDVMWTVPKVLVALLVVIMKVCDVVWRLC